MRNAIRKSESLIILTKDGLKQLTDDTCTKSPSFSGYTGCLVSENGVTVRFGKTVLDIPIDAKEIDNLLRVFKKSADEDELKKAYQTYLNALLESQPKK